MASPAALTDDELLAKYNLTDPGTDCAQFAQAVRQLGDKRRAVLHCKAESQAGWHLVVRYTIWGTDSQGQPLNTTADSAREALATIVRRLNERYAAQKQAERRERVTDFLRTNHP